MPDRGFPESGSSLLGALTSRGESAKAPMSLSIDGERSADLCIASHLAEQRFSRCAPVRGGCKTTIAEAEPRLSGEVRGPHGAVEGRFAFYQ